MNDNQYQKCAHCHKSLTLDMFRRMNWKNTGQPQIFKTCNQCINYKRSRNETIKINETKEKIDQLLKDVDKKIKFYSPMIYT